MVQITYTNDDIQNCVSTFRTKTNRNLRDSTHIRDSLYYIVAIAARELLICPDIKALDEHSFSVLSSNFGDTHICKKLARVLIHDLLGTEGFRGNQFGRYKIAYDACASTGFSWTFKVDKKV